MSHVRLRFRSPVLQLFFCPLFAVVLPAEGQGKLERVAINLHNNWYVQSSATVTDTGATISTPGYAHSGWLQTNIPATPLGAEFDNHLVPSPYLNENAAQISGTCYDVTTNYANVAWCAGSPYGPAPWWFLNQFTIPSTLAGQWIYIHFDGINYRANLWVNGTQIATNTQFVGTYTAFEFDITSVARIGATNGIALDITGPSSTDLGIVFVDWYPLPPDRKIGRAHV